MPNFKKNSQKFDRTNEERLTVFLYQWLNEKNLSLFDMNKQVIDWIKVEFWCKPDDFFTLIKQLGDAGYVIVPGNRLDAALFTEKGIKYVEDLIVKHGRIEFNINIEDQHFLY